MQCFGMMSIKHTSLVLLVLFALTNGASVGHAMSGGPCYDDWSDAGPIVRKEALMPVAEILKSVVRKQIGKVIKVKLCQRGETFYYKVALAKAGGTISWLLLNASTGRIQPLVRP